MFVPEVEYRCLMMDPPWAERGGGRIKRGADRHYGLLDVEDILRAVKTSGQFTPACDAHLWVWYTDNYLPDALWLVGQLGFKYKRTFQWVKICTHDSGHDNIKPGDVVLKPTLRGTRPAVRFGIGQYARGAHEGVLFATRGAGQDPAVWGEARDIPSVIFAPHVKDEQGKRVHSAKPPETYEVIERVSRGPRIEFFARHAREAIDGVIWASWGNEAPREDP